MLVSIRARSITLERGVIGRKIWRIARGILAIMGSYHAEWLRACAVRPANPRRSSPSRCTASLATAQARLE
ncbi:MAG: hypothetical protein ACR2GP_03900 [Burkholderiaceae bacterium]